MAYKFQPGKMYRMPTHFGPSSGPRQGKDGRRFNNRHSPKTTTVAVSFLTNREQLEALLPERFELNGAPVATVYASYMKEIEWLAGRGYNILGVTIPAAFNGELDNVKGSFLTVLWENLADPIITGREELGYAKIYCELPEPSVLSGEWHCVASWLSFKFLDLQANNLMQQSPREIAAYENSQSEDGALHYKYIPRTGEWGSSDVAYTTLTPAAAPNREIEERWVGDGSVRFHPAAWEDMPTQFNIVNTLCELEIKEYRGASVTKTVGGKDLSDQRILR